jgi:hypothetical protein
MAQVVKHLPSKPEALMSNLNMLPAKKKRERERERENDGKTLKRQIISIEN